MAEWGRKEYTKPWPSRTHVWTLGAVLLSCAVLRVRGAGWTGSMSELDGG